MIYRVTCDQAIALHGQICVAVLLDRNKLDGALAAPFATYDGYDLVPSLVGKVARLIKAVSIAHPFADGNKRLAWQCGLATLALNGVSIGDIDADEVNQVVRYLSHSSGDPELAAAWLNGYLL